VTAPRTFLLLAGLAASCAHSDAPAQVQTAPPAAAPPHAPTALDLMVAHAAELELRPAQVERLRALGKELDSTNAPLEQSLAKLGAEQPRTEGTTADAPARGRGGGGRGGFRGGGRGGMGGGMGAGGGRWRQGQGQGRPSGTNGAPAAQPARTHDDQAGTARAKMADNHAAAVARAFAVLDDAQQGRAARLLDENDFEPPSVEDVRAATQPAPR
jgi:hypothetical protein